MVKKNIVDLPVRCGRGGAVTRQEAHQEQFDLTMDEFEFDKAFKIDKSGRFDHPSDLRRLARDMFKDMVRQPAGNLSLHRHPLLMTRNEDVENGTPWVRLSLYFVPVSWDANDGTSYAPTP